MPRTAAPELEKEESSAKADSLGGAAPQSASAEPDLLPGSPRTPSGVAESGLFARRGTGVAALRQVQRSYGNRFSQSLVSHLSSGRSESAQRQCSCGGSCAKCTAQRAESVQPPASSGQPLTEPASSLMEQRFGASFEDVRLHTDSESAASAESIHADAYTAGRDIYFARGMYAPSSHSGQRLLAHELTHTLQQSSREVPHASHNHSKLPVGAPDDPLETEADQAAGDVVAGKKPEISGANSGPVRRQEAPPAPRAPTPEAVYDPCNVSVPGLTNEALLEEFNRTKAYLAARSKGEDDYYAYANLQRRVNEERMHRKDLGHVWLVEDLSAVPAELYQLSTGPFGEVFVNRISGKTVAGPPSALADGPVLTVGQFHKFLERSGIPTVDPAAFFARQNPNSPQGMHLFPSLSTPTGAGGQFGSSSTGTQPGLLPALGGIGVGAGGLYQSPADLFSMGLVSRPLPGSTIGRNQWRGQVAESYFQYGNGMGLPYQDLNAFTNPNAPNFPVYDYRTRLTGSLISVKSSVPGDPAAGPNMGTYVDGGFDVMFGTARPGKFTNSVNRLNTDVGIPLTQMEATWKSYLAVNSDHVDLVRAEVERRIRQDPGDYDPLMNVLLRDGPVSINATRYTSIQDLRNARANGTVSQADFDLAIGDLASRARGRVISNGATTAEYRNLVNMRQQYGSVAENDFGRLASPEFLEAERFGGGPAGAMMAMRRSAARGGAGGMVIAGGMDLGRMLFTGNGPDAGHFAIDVGLGGAGGAASSTIEAGIANQFSRSMLTRAATGESVSALSPILGRGLGGGVAGGVVAPLTTIGGMALDEWLYGADYDKIDYTAKGTRAFVSGTAAGAGGALAAAGVGALAGSEVPILGNIVGFFVGLGVYYIVDSAVGDDVESGVRQSMGEAGCPRPPVIKYEHDEYLRGGCFPGRTPIRLADGSSRAISSMQPGDLVLAYSMQTGKFIPAEVLRMHPHAPMHCLQLHLSDGSHVQITAEHPLQSNGEWRNAGNLQAGDTVAIIGQRPEELVLTQVVAIERLAEPEPVFNLTVSEPHTFFAAGVLVHNKNI